MDRHGHGVGRERAGESLSLGLHGGFYIDSRRALAISFASVGRAAGVFRRLILRLRLLAPLRMTAFF
jgi:hypothetical protein